MMDDPEKVLERLVVRGAAPDLRHQAMTRIGQALASEASSRWLWCSAAGVAAALLFAIGLNIWAMRVHDDRLAAIYGPQPMSCDVAEAAKAAKRSAGIRHYRQAIERIMAFRDLFGEESYHEAKEDNDHLRHRRRRSGGGASDHQRHSCPRDWITA